MNFTSIPLSLKRVCLLLLCIQLLLTPSHASLPFGDRNNVVVVAGASVSPRNTATALTTKALLVEVRGGGFLPGGYNPFGYKITKLGEQYLAFGETLGSDVGRFLASIKNRKTKAALKAQWIEIVKVSKTGQTMRIYRTMDELLKFCLDAGLVD
jgi:hypothetical protein